MPGEVMPMTLDEKMYKCAEGVLDDDEGSVGDLFLVYRITNTTRPLVWQWS